MLLLASGAQGTIIAIDLTQAGFETPNPPASGTGNIGGDTWRWDGGNPAFFDLEFSSGDGAHIDLDGGAAQGSEYYDGNEASTNHVYDVINASFLGGGVWRVVAVRGANSWLLGDVTEYSGALSHAANYDQSGSESHPTFGPSDAGGDSALPSAFKGWFWLYRDTTSGTVSLNVVTGSAAPNPASDGGQFRAEFTFSGSYGGALSVLEANDGAGELSLSGNKFTGNWDWASAYDDGGSMGGIVPVPVVPEPSGALLGGLGLTLLGLRRKR